VLLATKFPGPLEILQPRFSPYGGFDLSSYEECFRAPISVDNLHAYS